jgi:hypothetical protein
VGEGSRSRTAVRQGGQGQGRCSVAGARGEAGKSRGVQRKKKGKRSQGLICKTLKAQGSAGKLKIPIDPRIK